MSAGRARRLVDAVHGRRARRGDDAGRRVGLPARPPLRRTARPSTPPKARLVDGPRYPAQLAAMWRRLLPTVAIALLVQENAEHFATEGHLAGLDPLAGAFTLPVIALVTLAVAAVGALVRWRIAVLEGHIAAARAAAWPRPQAFRRPSAGPHHGRAPRPSVAAGPAGPGPGPAGRTPTLTIRPRPDPARRARTARGGQPMHIRIRAATSAVLVSIVVATVAAPNALAHEERELGEYAIEVGLIDEPVFVGEKSGLEVGVTKAEQPVDGLDRTLKAEVIVGDKHLDLPLTAREEQPWPAPVGVHSHAGRALHLPRQRNDRKPGGRLSPSPRAPRGSTRCRTPRSGSSPCSSRPRQT